tara:strand:+ start:302 stop:652 length:351 start_codon:yes stop_codon:yes gene_type:complete
MTEPATQQFIFHNGVPRRVDLTMSTDIEVWLEPLEGEEPQELALDSSAIIKLSTDETLILRNPKEMTDEELQDALAACKRMRLAASDRPKSKAQRTTTRKAAKGQPGKLLSDLLGI